MENEFVSYEQAVAFRELGLDEMCLGSFGITNHTLYKVHTDKFDDIDEIHFVRAPLKQQVFRWFREKYGVYPTIMTETEDDSLYFRFIVEGGPEWLSFSKIYYTYEEAENACIDKLIEIAKQL